MNRENNKTRDTDTDEKRIAKREKTSIAEH